MAPHRTGANTKQTQHRSTTIDNGGHIHHKESPKRQCDSRATTNNAQDPRVRRQQGRNLQKRFPFISTVFYTLLLLYTNPKSSALYTPSLHNTLECPPHQPQPWMRALQEQLALNTTATCRKKLPQHTATTRRRCRQLRPQKTCRLTTPRPSQHHPAAA